jgi:hypothetical protein
MTVFNPLFDFAIKLRVVGDILTGAGVGMLSPVFWLVVAPTSGIDTLVGATLVFLGMFASVLVMCRYWQWIHYMGGVGQKATSFSKIF